MKEVYIHAAMRTPVGSFQGSLAGLTAPQLGALAIKAVLAESSIAAQDVDEVFMGNVISAGLGQAPARQAMRQAEIPDGCGATTINKVCGSGMKATMLGTDLICAGSAMTVICGGMESMSNAPYLLPKARGGLRMGHKQLQDAMFLDGLEDAETGGSMGSFAQATADSHQISRQAMDNFAIQSVTRARQAIEQNSLVDEIVPVAEMRDDEQPAKANLERIPQLRPAFKKDGTITAANSSSISDGASALLLAATPGKAPLARICGHTTHSRHPSEFTLAPADAISKLLKSLRWQIDDIDLFEINEAFAMVTMLAIAQLKLDPEKVNIYGGACAQGHPIGSTGSRLIVTLAHGLQRLNKNRGIAALCIGGGEATAVAIERC